jgi:molybdopterin synthase catalytic subunit
MTRAWLRPRSSAARWPAQAITVVHRHGKIAVGEVIVLVVAASPHRDAAFDAARCVMDFMKTNAPSWKKEHLTGGAKAGGWVESRVKDDAAREWWRDRR